MTTHEENVKVEKKLVRKEFWKFNPKWKRKYFSPNKAQNDYPADIRAAFVQYVDSLERDGTISEEAANEVTL